MPPSNWILTGIAGVTICVTGCRIIPLQDVATPPAPPGPQRMAFVPAGDSEMGDLLQVGYSNERPSHHLFISAFFIDRTETTQAEWERVYRWATNHGYRFEAPAQPHDRLRPDHPVCNVNWYDAVKWANARSELERRPAVYFTDASRRQVYRAGRVDVAVEAVDWTAEGYRLPTEAEWEKAARGGLLGQNYPWPSPGTNFTAQLDGSRANYFGSNDPFEADAECPTTPVGWFDGRRNQGSAMTNGFGLWDVAGNVAEWCWDWHDDDWYRRPEAGSPDTRGPLAGVGRSLRGGSWISSAKFCRVSARYVSEPHYPCHCYGFRLVLNATPSRKAR